MRHNPAVLVLLTASMTVTTGFCRGGAFEAPFDVTTVQPAAMAVVTMVLQRVPPDWQLTIVDFLNSSEPNITRFHQEIMERAAKARIPKNFASLSKAEQDETRTRFAELRSGTRRPVAELTKFQERLNNPTAANNRVIAQLVTALHTEFALYFFEADRRRLTEHIRKVAEGLGRTWSVGSSDEVIATQTTQSATPVRRKLSAQLLPYVRKKPAKTEGMTAHWSDFFEDLAETKRILQLVDTAKNRRLFEVDLSQLGELEADHIMRIISVHLASTGSDSMVIDGAQINQKKLMEKLKQRFPEMVVDNFHLKNQSELSSALYIAAMHYMQTQPFILVISNFVPAPNNKGFVTLMRRIYLAQVLGRIPKTLKIIILSRHPDSWMDDDGEFLPGDANENRVVYTRR